MRNNRISLWCLSLNLMEKLEKKHTQMYDPEQTLPTQSEVETTVLHTAVPNIIFKSGHSIDSFENRLLHSDCKCQKKRNERKNVRISKEKMFGTVW